MTLSDVRKVNSKWFALEHKRFPCDKGGTEFWLINSKAKKPYLLQEIRIWSARTGKFSNISTSTLTLSYDVYRVDDDGRIREAINKIFSDRSSAVRFIKEL